MSYYFICHAHFVLFLPVANNAHALRYSVKLSRELILIYFRFMQTSSGKGRQISFPLNDNTQNFSVITRLKNFDSKFQEHQTPRIFASFLKVKLTTILPGRRCVCFAGVVCGGHTVSGQYPHANASVDEPYAYKTCLSTGAPLILPPSLHLTPDRPT